jgi:hypothetical protein
MTSESYEIKSRFRHFYNNGMLLHINSVANSCPHLKCKQKKNKFHKESLELYKRLLGIRESKLN